jgi:thioredoxin 1
MSKFQDSIKSDKPTLVDFFATWCGPCKTMSPIVDQLKTKMGNQLTVLKVDIDKNQHAVELYKIRSVPTIILFKKGKMIWKQAGGLDFRSLEKKVKSAL